LAHGLNAQSSSENVDIPEGVQNCKMMVMTSHENHAETVKFFKANNYFGGNEKSFVFFPQAMLPAVDANGKILMSSESTIKLAPNGNGALFDSISKRPEIQEIFKQLEYVQVIGVDNSLNKVLDPLFIGFTYFNQLQVSMKALPKRNAEEKVGVVAIKNGKYDIVEYSEFSPELAAELTADGSRLKFYLGNILIFLFNAKFLLDQCTGSSNDQSLYHRAHKSIAHWDGEKEVKSPGWKFELFIHNVMSEVTKGKLGVFQVERETDFAPVKNANGPEEEALVNDSPAQSRQMILEEAT